MTLSLVPRQPKVVIPRSVPITTDGTTPATITTISALPDTVNLNLYAGDDFQMSLTLTNPDGSNTSLVGTTVLAQIRTSPGAPVVASFTPSVSGNIITLTLLSAASQGLSGKYVWDCQITNNVGEVWTLVAGAVNFTQDVTR